MRGGGETTDSCASDEFANTRVAKTGKTTFEILIVSSFEADNSGAGRRSGQSLVGVLVLLYGWMLRKSAA
jgi:hypothetical protein